MTTLADAGEVQPDASVTVKVYVVPAVRPIKGAVAPVPVCVAPPGDAVSVHVPVAGKPLNATLPVAVAHVGCVIVPIVGAEGVEGCVLTVTGVAADTQLPSFTVTL